MAFCVLRMLYLALIGVLVLHPAIAFGLNSTASPTPPAVSLDPITFTTADRITFKTFPGDTINRDSRPFKPEHSYQTDDQKYAVFFDPDSLVFDIKNNCFTFDLVVRTTAASGPAWVVSVRGDPVGRFPDALEDVDVKIQPSPLEKASSGKVKIPVHSPEYDEAIEVVKDSDQPFMVVPL